MHILDHDPDCPVLLASEFAQAPLTAAIVKVSHQQVKLCSRRSDWGGVMIANLRADQLTDSGTQLHTYRQAMLLLMADG